MQVVELMKKYGIDLSTFKSTNIKDANVQNMDIILCATKNHKEYVLQLYSGLNDRIFTLKEYAQNYSGNTDIKDPWGFNIHTYKQVAKEIEKCLETIIDKLD